MALLFTTACFLMGGLPLLVLKHDVELDAPASSVASSRVLRSRVLDLAGRLTTGFLLLWGRFLFAGGALLITLLTVPAPPHVCPRCSTSGNASNQPTRQRSAKFRRVRRRRWRSTSLAARVT